MGIKSRIMGVKKCFELIRIRWLVWENWRRNGLSHRYFEEFLVFLGFVHSPTFEIMLATCMFGYRLNYVLEKTIRATSEFTCQAKTIFDMLENNNRLRIPRAYNNKKEDKCDDHE